MNELTNQPGEMAGASNDEKMWAMLCHLSTFAGYVIPFGNIIAPLLIWIMKKEEFPLANDQGKEVLNFQISFMIYLAIALLLIIVVIGIALAIALVLFEIIITIIAAVNAYDGARYRYPMTIRFIK
ncbi:MAG: DUF4870 domain-containing protein [Calditrichaceae bacterium]|nr:DUF4870 domain-containing protein [Calditrichia bacterium]NUQ40499.1 DUF4870 domain-containing protein [Calditrichaceae bacterium]